jgi:adenylate cyclase
VQLLNLQRQNAKKVLYRLYAQRVASMRQSPPGASWDGSTTFDTK